MENLYFLKGFGDALRLSREVKQEQSWFHRTVECLKSCLEAFHEYIDHFDSGGKKRDALEVFLLKIKCPSQSGMASNLTHSYYQYDSKTCLR